MINTFCPQIEAFAGRFVVDPDFRKKVEKNPRDVITQELNLSPEMVEEIVKRIKASPNLNVSHLAGWT